MTLQNGNAVSINPKTIARCVAALSCIAAFASCSSTRTFDSTRPTQPVTDRIQKRDQDVKAGLERRVIPAQPLNDERRVAVARTIAVNDGQVARGTGATSRVLMTPEQQAEWCQQVAIRLVTASLGTNYDIRRTETVGPKIGAELMRSGIIAVILTMLGIAAYVWFRYEWQFAVGALVALTHDVLTTVGFFVITQLEFNLTALAALLTIAGYSVNDTVVVFDRVRENMRRYKKMSLVDMLNVSVNETMSRTIMTSGTVFFAMVALALFGGPVLHSFSYAMLWGVIVGTYSSIWIACAGLVYLNLRVDRLRDHDDIAKGEVVRP